MSARGEDRRQTAHGRLGPEAHDVGEAVLPGAAPDRDLAGPGVRRDGDQRRMRRLVLAQLRQVEERDLGRPEDRGPRRRGSPRRAGRQVVVRPVLPHRLDGAAVGIADRDDPVLGLPPVMGEAHHVARIEREPGGRQPEGRGLASGPGLHQRAPAAALGLLGRNGHGEGLRRDPARRHGDAPRLDQRAVVIPVGAGERPLQRLRQLGLLAAGELEIARPMRRPHRRRRPCHPVRQSRRKPARAS
jgi:hypothetical protein